MQLTEKHSKVLIVGAGPSGLMMAAQLLRYGIQPVIIDKKQGPTIHSQALAVQARTVEIYRQMGISERAVADGKQARGLQYYPYHKTPATLELRDIGQGQTPFPFVLLYEQNKNERLLLDYLTANACPVYWETSLETLQYENNTVTAKLNRQKSVQTLDCDWVIGADGAHSSVRKLLQIPFSGATYGNHYYLLDAALDAPFLDSEYVQIYLGKGSFTGFFPLKERNSFRVIGNLPAKLVENITASDLLPQIAATTGSEIRITKENWFTTYKLHHRMAERFRDNRCFLIGDAAHIHSPIGGQGMNTGIQDAYNLAWKLAGVINGDISENILNSYAEERMPVARQLLSTTDRAFNIGLSDSWIMDQFKKHILPNVLRFLWDKQTFRNTFFKRLSQTGISYRDSKINLHLAKSERIRAGDRVPFIEIFDEKKKEETDLHAWCSKPGFTLIILGRFDDMLLFNIAKWISTRYPGMLNFFYLPPSGKNLAVFDAFETDPHREKAIIVRPDMHIGYMNDLVSISMLDNYLKNVAGLL